MHESTNHTCEVCHRCDCDGRVLSPAMSAKRAMDALRMEYGLPLSLKGEAYVLHKAKDMALVSHSARMQEGKGFTNVCMCTSLTASVAACVADDILHS